MLEYIILDNIEDTPVESIDNVLNVNLKGTLFLLKTILPNMRQNKFGTIVLMGSDQCFIGKGESSIYGATKGAIGQLTKSTAIDYAKFNIRVNCICPGTIDTPLVHNLFNVLNKRSEDNENIAYEQFYSNQLIKRLGTPEEIAQAVLFMSSKESSFMTGTLLPVDGGYTAQ